MSDRPPSKAPAGHVWNDPKTPGLALRFFGGKAVYYLRYRTKTGQQRNQKIGTAADFSLTQARERALKIRQRVADGEDPAADFKVSGKTLADLATDHTEKHVRAKLKGRAAAEARRVWDRDILPALGATTRVKDVTLAQVMAMHEGMVDRQTHANRVVAQLSKAMNIAIKWGWRPPNSNPCIGVEKYPERKRKRKPEKTEPVRLMLAMEAMRAEQPIFIALIELVALTGARVGEIRTAKRSDLHDDGLHVDSKTGEKVLPLSTFAWDVIGEIPHVDGNEYLIPGDKAGRPLVNYAKRWAALLKRAGISNLHVHDLRRFFASAGLSSGETLSAIGQVLGHTQAQTTMRYAFLMTDQAQATAEAAATRVRELMTGAGKVTPLKRK